MSNFVRVAFYLDRVLAGRYAGRNITFTTGDSLTEYREAADGSYSVREVKKPGFEPVLSASGATLGFIRVEDGGPRPPDADLEAAMNELISNPPAIPKSDQERIASLEARLAAFEAAQPPKP